MKLSGQQGQAATECVITSVFVLVPLFLIIPLLGKYIDIKHATINQARYEAWEYTAWFGPAKKGERPHILSDNPEHHSAGPKSWEKTRQEGNLLFFSDPTAQDYGTDQQNYLLNPLWKDHRGDWMFSGRIRTPDGTIRQEDTPDPTKVGGTNLIDGMLDIINLITETFGKLLEKMGVNASFDAIDIRGFFISEVKIKVRSLEQMVPEFDLADSNENSTRPLEFSAKAAVLSNDWSSGSSKKAITESKGLVVTSILKPLTGPLQKIIDTLQGVFDELHKYTPIDVGLPNLPDFGYIQDDLVPLEYLRDEEGDSRFNRIPSKSEHGLYFYEKKEE